MLRGFRVAEVVDGRVGGLLSELDEVVPRAVVVVAVLDVVDEEVGRLAAAVELDVGRLEVAVVPVALLAGDAGTFSLDASGLDLTSSLPESTVESTGVAGGAFSTSASAAGGTGSSVDAISTNWFNQRTGGV